MNSPSAFQRQYPLSPKKFTKKMISALPKAFFVGLFFSIIISVLVSLLKLSSKTEPTITGIVIAFVITLVVIWALYLIIYGLYVSAYIKRYYYDVSDQYITIQKGVFAPTEIHVPYHKIQDVYVDQDVLDRIMGIYDVHIASATVTSGIEAHIDGVDPHVAESLKNLLLNKIQLGPGMGSGMTQHPAHVQSQASQIIPPAPGAFNSQTFPIVGRWVALIFVSNIWHAAWTTFVLMLFFFRGTEMSGFSAWIFLVLYFIIYLGMTIGSLLWRATYAFDFGSQFVLVKDGVIKREEKHVPYRSIQNVLLKRGIFERLFGLSTVVIENAAVVAGPKGTRSSRITIPGQPLTKGQQLSEELNRILGQMTTPATGL